MEEMNSQASVKSANDVVEHGKVLKQDRSNTKESLTQGKES